MAAPKKVSVRAIAKRIEETIPDFHAARLESLLKLKLNKLLKRKNPYLFRAKNILIASDLVKEFLAAHLSSQEEALFGTFLERLAVWVASEVWSAHKSTAEGIDLEWESDKILFLVAIKSGPNWANSGQIAALRANFLKATRIARTNSKHRPIRCVNGCCYGKIANEDQGDYIKLCGQAFWEFISNDPQFYRTIIEPIGHNARERNEEFLEEFSKVANRFTMEFSDLFCKADGAIDWDKLLEFNSGK